jgi:hypothetical protein
MGTKVQNYHKKWYYSSLRASASFLYLCLKPKQSVPMKTLWQTLVVVALSVGMLRAQNVGIGTATPQTRLHVHGAGGVTDGIRVTSTGADAPTINFYAGTATPDAGHISFGDNTGWRFHITRASDGTNLVTVQDNGDVGIGTVTPTQRLHVVGNVQFSGALMPGGNAGTTGQVLVSQGAGNAPQWQAPSALTGFYKLLFVDAWNPSVTSNLDWSCSGCDGAPPYLTTCGSVRMLGGYGICGNGCYFEKTFTGLPAHTEVKVEVFWWSVDSWNQDIATNVDLVALRIDGTEVSRATPYAPYGPGSEARNTDASVCGLVDIDIGPQILVGWTAHTASSVTVRVINLADQDSINESMGIVMVRVWVK